MRAVLKYLAGGGHTPFSLRTDPQQAWKAEPADAQSALQAGVYLLLHAYRYPATPQMPHAAARSGRGPPTVAHQFRSAGLAARGVAGRGNLAA